MAGINQRPDTFFPSQLKAYRQCPQRYALQYVKRLKRPHPFSAALVKGGAVHRLIARHAPAYLRQQQIPANLLAQARAEVETTEYPPGERAAIEQDARDVAEWTLTGLRLLPDGARPLLVEKNLYAPVKRSDVRVGARVDLVLQREDGAIEHIDFKTGKHRDDPVQMLISRVVVGYEHPRAPRIQTTTLYLQHHLAESAELQGDDYRAEWRDLLTTIREIRAADGWPPSPGPLCDYCPYKARDCSAW